MYQKGENKMITFTSQPKALQITGPLGGSLTTPQNQAEISFQRNNGVDLSLVGADSSLNIQRGTNSGTFDFTTSGGRTANFTQDQIVTAGADTVDFLQAAQTRGWSGALI